MLLPVVIVVTVVAAGCGGGDAKPIASQPSSNRSTSTDCPSVGNRFAHVRPCQEVRKP